MDDGLATASREKGLPGGTGNEGASRFNSRKKTSGELRKSTKRTKSVLRNENQRLIAAGMETLSSTAADGLSPSCRLVKPRR